MVLQPSLIHLDAERGVATIFVSKQQLFARVIDLPVRPDIVPTRVTMCLAKTV